MRRSIVLDVVVRVVFHTTLLLGAFLLVTGHDRPGGGFAGGLVISAGLALHLVAGGVDQVRSVLPVRPWTLIGSGLALASATALVPLLAGRALLDHATWDLELGPLGELHVGSALAFDLGILLVVVGMVLMVLVGFGARLPAPSALAPGAEDGDR